MMAGKTGGRASSRGLIDRGTRAGHIDPEGLYRAVEAVSFVDGEGVPLVFTRDTVLLGRHEWVQQFPQYFAPEGDPEAQARARAALVDWDEQVRLHQGSKRSDIRVVEAKCRAKRSVRVDVDGKERKVKKGEVVDPSELICRLLPNAFEEISVEVER